MTPAEAALVLARLVEDERSDDELEALALAIVVLSCEGRPAPMRAEVGEPGRFLGVRPSFARYRC